MKVLALALFSALAVTPLMAAQQASKPDVKKFDVNKKFKTAFAYKPGFVISPFKPYNVINIKHLRPGDLAYDPTTAAKDPKTGKPVISTAKIFRVPQPKPQAQVATSTS